MISVVLGLVVVGVADLMYESGHQDFNKVISGKIQTKS